MDNDGFLENLIGQFQAMPPARRIVLVATAAISLAFFGWIATGAGKTADRLLFGGLEPADAAKIADALVAERIPYHVEDGGTSIYVPASQIHEARIRVASKGLPAGGGAGFELFDKDGFGVTEFVQRVNYRRALQGELARSIEALGPVDSARVQIALPEPSAFVGRKSRQPSASVVVKMVPGRDFTQAQVQGVVHLVASSVEGLSPESVTLVDGRGRLLSSPGEGAEGAPGAAPAYQTQLEAQLAQRIEAMLGRTVGLGRVVAEVSADLDWTRRETTEERFDPASQIERSEQRSSEERLEGLAAAGGVPGVQANLPGGEGAGGSDNASSTTTSETINYEISKTVSRSVSSMARIERLSLAILVDGKPGAADGEFAPWTAEELQSFEGLAKQAVGFDAARGDTITLRSAPFHSVEFAPEDPGGGLSPELLPLVGQALRGVLLLAALVLFALLVVRPLAAALRSTPGAGAIPPRVEELLARLEATGEEEGADALEAGGGGASALAALGGAGATSNDDPLNTLRGWLRES